MAAYLIVNLDIHDPEKFGAYRERVAPLVEKRGGRYLVRGGELHPIEGDFGLKRLVILEFPSMEAARGFYSGAGADVVGNGGGVVSGLFNES